MKLKSIVFIHILITAAIIGCTISLMQNVRKIKVDCACVVDKQIKVGPKLDPVSVHTINRMKCEQVFAEGWWPVAGLYCCPPEVSEIWRNPDYCGSCNDDECLNNCLGSCTHIYLSEVILVEKND